MKKLTVLLLLVAMNMTAMAQSYRAGLVKDEGGFTNVRKGPGTNYAVVDKIQDGFFVNFQNMGNGWAKIYTNYTDDTPQDLIGYMSMSKIVVPQRKGEYKYVAMVAQEGGYTNIRKGPGTNYAVVGKVRDGSYILYSGDFNSNWYKVYTQKGVFRGYMAASKLESLESPQF